jgi:hypothetical protein
MAPLPASAELLKLEQVSRRQGTGLVAADLIGIWRLQRVWPRQGGEPSGPSSALLRGLGARLEINASGVPAADLDIPRPGALADAGLGEGELGEGELGEGELGLVNAVKLGPLELRFEGRARLAGSRPLLWFGFDQLQLRFGSQVLLQRSLPPAAAQRQPFFALIGKGPGWLAARGRGGGLALWQLQTPAPPLGGLAPGDQG